MVPQPLLLFCSGAQSHVVMTQLCQYLPRVAGTHCGRILIALDLIEFSVFGKTDTRHTITQIILQLQYYLDLITLSN